MMVKQNVSHLYYNMVLFFPIWFYFYSFNYIFIHLKTCLRREVLIVFSKDIILPPTPIKNLS